MARESWRLRCCTQTPGAHRPPRRSGRRTPGPTRSPAPGDDRRPGGPAAAPGRRTPLSSRAASSVPPVSSRASKPHSSHSSAIRPSMRARCRSCPPYERRPAGASLGWPVTEIEIGRAKRARRAYSFDDVAIVPSRRTRDPEEVSVAWQIDAYRFELPVLAAPMDSVMSPGDRDRLRQARWSRRAQPRGPLDPVRRPVAAAGRGRRAATGRGATQRMQEIYAEPIKPELITERLQRDPRRRA